MVQTAEAIVIGGEIFGASTAYYLTKLGFGKVLVLEKSFLAFGSTGHSAAASRKERLFDRLGGLDLGAEDSFVGSLADSSLC